MLNIVNRPIQRLIIRGSGTAVVHSKPSAQVVRLVQTVSPVPSGAGEVADPGDLTLLLENKLI